MQSHKKENSGKAKRLVSKLGLNVVRQYYRETGDWYAPILGYPCALFDPYGYIVLSEQADLDRHKIKVYKGDRIFVDNGISSLTGYTYLPISEERSLQPTSNLILLDRRVQDLRNRGPISRPAGNTKPNLVKGASHPEIQRLPAVKAWILQEAKGICELCRQRGPFLTHQGESYLEVHHVVQLAGGGPDTVENSVALCPNCHRLLHFGVDADSQRQKLYLAVPRVKGE